LLSTSRASGTPLGNLEKIRSGRRVRVWEGRTRKKYIETGESSDGREGAVQLGPGKGKRKSENRRAASRLGDDVSRGLIRNVDPLANHRGVSEGDRRRRGKKDGDGEPPGGRSSTRKEMTKKKEK